MIYVTPRDPSALSWYKSYPAPRPRPLAQYLRSDPAIALATLMERLVEHRILSLEDLRSILPDAEKVEFIEPVQGPNPAT